MQQRLAINFWKIPLFGALIVCGCAGVPDLATRQSQAEKFLPESHISFSIRTQTFDLFSYAPKEMSSLNQLIVFVEGDGFAWQTRRKPSDDPTPISQTVLSLFSASNRTDTAYLARPCQYVGANSRNCSPDIWTGGRYSEAVVAALDEAISTLSARHGGPKITLIGYSGGGTLAALLAARRTDVGALITLASPLDTDAFTDHHGVSPMVSSLNPLDFVAELSRVPQIHIFGREDLIVPASLAETYLRALPDTRCVQVKLAAADHWKGWAETTPNPANLLPACETALQ